jgi:Phytoene dehydrogenase and related proteins
LTVDGDFDAVVVGAGPNGLVAAATLGAEGWRVLLVEATAEAGGGSRSEQLTLPGFVHDVCSAIHPLAAASPAMRSLPLAKHGLEWIHSTVPLAHPLDGGRVALLERSVDATASGFGIDANAYRRLVGPFVDAGDTLIDALMSPLDLPPRHPWLLARYGAIGVRSANGVARRFATDEPAALLSGLAGHSMLALQSPITAGFALFLGTLAHHVGWPVAKGGSGAIAKALAAIVVANGGTIVCDHRVTSLRELPPARATLLDLTPRQVLAIDDGRLPARYRRTLERFRYGSGIFKVDWALDSPTPWTNPEILRAATVHLGGSAGEIVAAELDVQQGRHPELPFTLFAQPSLFDPTRAPAGKHTAWAYCHVPHGSTVDMSGAIEAQVERFAPGFRACVLARHTMGPAAMEAHDANYVGGDINGGVADLRQFFARPRLSLHPWATPVPGLYLCSSSTPPGGGVHGMCGWHAARLALHRHR